jgi:RNA-directed DNA polymerase
VREGALLHPCLTRLEGPAHALRGQHRQAGQGSRTPSQELYLAAKRSPERRFHALWDRIHRRDVRQRAWQQVRENRGSAGVDRITITEIEEGGVEAFLDGLEAELKAECYRPGLARRVFVPKPGRSEQRPLGIP